MNKTRLNLARFALVAFLVAMALLWRGVFMMTGILWWQAPRPEARPTPPPPAQFRPANTDWIDLNAYRRNNPFWLM